MQSNNNLSELNVSYVYIEKELHDMAGNKMQYHGYIEIPMSQKTFESLTPNQQRAVCQAQLLKIGLIAKPAGKYPDVEKFKNE